MDTKVIGQFLARLRKDSGLTQEQLGERLGVTNKIVSRWENGNYLPPVEMLQSLSEFYGLTINEILSGKVLAETEYKQQAEENIKSVLQSSFTLKERIEFYEKKWKKEHISTYIFGAVIFVALVVAGSILDNGLLVVGFIWWAWFILHQNNQMKIYVEDRAFDGSGPY